MVRMEGIGIELKGLTPYRRCRRPFLRHVMLPSSAHLFAVPRRCRAERERERATSTPDESESDECC